MDDIEVQVPSVRPKVDLLRKPKLLQFNQNTWIFFSNSDKKKFKTICHHCLRAFFEHLLYQTLLGHFACITSFNPLSKLMVVGTFYSHFKDKETDPLRLHNLTRVTKYGMYFPKMARKIFSTLHILFFNKLFYFRIALDFQKAQNSHIPDSSIANILQ